MIKSMTAMPNHQKRYI